MGIRLAKPPRGPRVAQWSRTLCGAAVVLWWAVAFTSAADAQTVTSTVTYTYGDEISGHTNAIGRLALVEEREGGTTVVRSASFDYDVRGNVTRTVRVLDGATYTTDQTYDSLNRVETVTYPDTPTREVVTNTFDFAGNLKTVTGVDGAVTTNYVTNVQYDAFSKRTRLTLGNGTQTDYTYDTDTFRLQQLRAIGPGGVLQDLNYTYDAVGNVLTIRDGLSPGYNESFDYDDLHRLTGAFGAYGSMTYAYDQIGNMTCNSQLGPCTATSPNYAYPPSGSSSVRPHAVNQAGPYTYTYDANGNMTSRSTSAGVDRSLTYDVNNRPTGMTVGSSTVNFAYDYTGERVRKQVVGGAMTTYVGAIYECAASCTKYFFAGSTRVAQKTVDGTVVYFHGNHLGSTHIVTNSSGTAVEEIHYYPYGETYSDSNGEAGGVNYRYTGQQLDVETSLYYYHARYYDPVLGRFVSADIAGVNLSIPQSLNRYSYVLNNPLRFIDPAGFQACNTDAGGATICMGTDGPIIFPKDPAADAIVGTPDGVFDVGRADAIQNLQLALDREANPGGSSTWLPSWMLPAGGSGGGGGSCSSPNMLTCFGQQLGTSSKQVEVFSPSTGSFPASGDATTSLSGGTSRPEFNASQIRGAVSFDAYLPFGGGGLTFGRNPDGTTFMGLRGGRGMGGGFAYDPYATSPGYASNRPRGPLSMAVGVFFEAEASGGFWYGGGGMQAGIAFEAPSGANGYWRPGPSYRVGDQYRYRLGVAGGAEVTLY